MSDMSYTIDYLQDEGMVLIRNNGGLTYIDIVKQTHEALEVGRINKCRLFLVDCTSMSSRFGTVDIFSLPKVYENLEAPRTNKVALITSEDKDTRADIRFYETACVNRGWPVRVFNDKKAAMKWLQEGPRLEEHP